LRQFWDVTCPREEAVHNARAQAIDQAVDQGLRPYFPVSLSETCLCVGERLGDESRKRHQVDAEAHVDGLDLVLNQAQEMLWLARGGAEPRLDQERGAVGAADPKRNPPAATPGVRKLRAKCAGEMIEAGQDAVMGDERFWKGKPRHEVGRRQEGGMWLGAPPKRLIEAKEDGFGRVFGVEPPLEARPRQIVELADALKPEPSQEARNLRLKAQGLDGKGRKRGPDLSFRDNERRTRVAGKRMRPAQGFGKSKPRGETRACEPSS
jgi:hypothetical protein